MRPDATEEAMPPVSDAAAAVLVSIGFRNSSEVCRTDVHLTCVSCLDILGIIAGLSAPQVHEFKSKSILGPIGARKWR